MKSIVYWNVGPYILVKVYVGFERKYCLYLHGGRYYNVTVGALLL
jgi:hypothetical protein